MSDKCEWLEDEYGDWRLACTERQVKECGPADISYRFCPYCGGGIVTIPFQDEEEE